MQGRWGLRAAAFLALGALALHELSYWVTDGLSGVGSHAHSYMPLAAGLVAVLMLLACASFARTLLLATRGIEDEGEPPPFRMLWPLMAVALVSVFALQEWVEGWVTPGHPAGLGHVAGHIGPGGLAIATALAGLIAVLLRGARSAVAAIARRHAAPRARRAPLRTPPVRPFFLPRLDVLAAKSAGRAPPLTS
ncbi:MAG TPA: hypothetical protein VFB51_06590 [Solirubrobacterales bacterium]|nr:hypothetical protein [Solirubrobacterales bacterium]